MTDIPIIFSGPMVRALLDGRKTMTRRLAWRATKPTPGFPEGTMRATPWQNVKPGDRLWVRESLWKHDFEGWRYSADNAAVSLSKDHPGVSAMISWAHHIERDSAPSIHMPRWASRLTLIATGVRVERLDTISHDDALAEGCKALRTDCYVFEGTGYACHGSPVTAFSILWDDLHGDGAWNENPEVVAITFRVIRANIDAPEAMAA